MLVQGQMWQCSQQVFKALLEQYSKEVAIIKAPQLYATTLGHHIKPAKPPPQVCVCVTPLQSSLAKLANKNKAVGGFMCSVIAMGQLIKMGVTHTDTLVSSSKSSNSMFLPIKKSIVMSQSMTWSWQGNNIVEINFLVTALHEAFCQLLHILWVWM